MGRIEVKGILELDGSGWERSIRKAEAEIEHLAREGFGELKGIISGAFTVGAIEEFSRQVIETASNIKKLSEQSDTSIKEVQKLNNAAKEVGLEFQDVQRWASKFGQARQEAGEHEGELLVKLEKFGVTLNDIRNPMLTNIDLMEKMKVKMKELSETAEGRRNLTEFFGRGGDKISSVLSNRDPLNRAVMDEKTINTLYESGEKVEGTWSRFWGGISKITSMVIDPFAGGAESMREEIEQRNKNLDKLLGISDEKPKSEETIFNFKENKSLWEQLHKAEQENREAGLTHEEKILELKKEQAELVEKMKTDKGDELVKDQIQLVQLDTKMKELQLQHPHLGLKTSDSLTKTGNFLGSSANSIVSIGERQVHLLQQIVHNTNPKNANSTGNMNGTSSAPGL